VLERSEGNARTGERADVAPGPGGANNTPVPNVRGPMLMVSLAWKGVAKMKRLAWVPFCCLLPIVAQSTPLPLSPGAGSRAGTIATFSCVGFDPETGDLGVIVQSKFFAVGSVVPWARADVGAVASQAFGNTSFGPRGLDLLAEGKSPDEALTALLAADSLRERRQVGIVDAKGRSATYTGKQCMPWAGGISGPDFAAQGNILVGEATVQAMSAAFQSTKGMLGDRLMAAIEAGQAAGGDSRGMQSAAILIVRKGGGYGGNNDRYCDLRVDDATDPIAELHRIYNIWKPNALVTEGYELVAKGQFERAYAMGLEAIALRPDAGEYRYHLACYYARGGEREKAIETLGEALSREPALSKQAAVDTDLAPLGSDPRFGRMLEAATKAAVQEGAPKGR
jgi:uncharacterized Ntn-hydrolase superfamily protein